MDGTKQSTENIRGGGYRVLTTLLMVLGVIVVVALVAITLTAIIAPNLVFILLYFYATREKASPKKVVIKNKTFANDKQN